MAQFDIVPQNKIFSTYQPYRVQPYRTRYSTQFSLPAQNDEPSTFQKAFHVGGRILNFLDRPRSAVVNVLQDYTETGRLTPFTSFYEGILGQEQPLVSDVLADLGWEPTTTLGKIARGAVGFAGDVALDPLTYIGVGGLTELGKTRRIINGLSKNPNIALEGGKFVARQGAKLGRLQKTIDKVNDIVRALPEQQALDLIDSSTRYLSKSDEAAKGYRALLRVGTGAGTPVIKGGRFYDKQSAIADLTMEVPFLRSVRNKFIKPYKSNPVALAAHDAAEAVSGEFRFNITTQLGEFYEGLIKDKNLTPDLMKQIPSFTEFSHNRKKIAELFGEQALANETTLAPHIARLTKIRDYAQSVLGENGVNIQDTHSYLKTKLDDLIENRKVYIGDTKDVGKVIKDTKTLRKNIVSGKFKPMEGMGLENYETILTATKELYENAPSWLPHFLTDDASFQIAKSGKGSRVSGLLYDEKTASFITRKFTDNYGVPLGLEETNRLVQTAGTNLTNNEPIFKRESFVSQLLKRKNKALATQYDNIAHLPDERDAWLAAHTKELGELFNTDPATIADTIVQRTARSLEEGVFQNEMISKFGFTEEALAQIKGVSIDDLKKGEANVLAGYRKLKLDRLKNLKDLPDEFTGHLKNLSDLSDKIYFPEQIANVLESMYNGLGEHYNDFISFVHKSTNLMKAWLTIPNPAFHGRNFISSLWMAWTDDVSPLRNISDYVNSVKLNHYVRNKDIDALKRMRIAGYSGEDVLKLLFKHDVVGVNYHDVGQLNKKLSVLEKSNRLNVLNPFDTQEFAPFVGGRKVMQQIEDHIRSAHFISKLESGLSPLDAAKQVAKVHYKYSDVTQFESSILATMLPFYRWMRFNIPRQFELAAQNPVKILGTMHLVKNVQDILTDKDYADEILLPKWLQENMGVQVTKKDGVTGFTALGSFFPFGVLAEFNEPKDAVEFIKKSMNPAIKTALEVGLNFDVYFGTEIEKYPGQTESFLGVDIPKKWLKLIKIIRPLNEIDRAFMRGSEKGDSVTRQLLDFGFGIKKHDVDFAEQHKFKMLDLKSENNKIKYDIRKANVAGDKEKAQRLREQIQRNTDIMKDLNYALMRARGGGVR